MQLGDLVKSKNAKVVEVVPHPSNKLQLKYKNQKP